MYRARSIITILAYGLIISGLVGALLVYVFPDHYPHWFEGIVGYFLLIEVLIVAFVETESVKPNQKTLLNTYLLTKVIKMLLSLAFIGVYAAVVKEGIKNFVLIFMSFYILFLAAETLIFVGIEKRLKKNNKVE